MSPRPSSARTAVLAVQLMAVACSPHKSTPPIQPPMSGPQAAAAPSDAGMGDETGSALDALSRSLEGVWCWANVKQGSQNAHNVRFSSDAKKMHLGTEPIGLADSCTMPVTRCPPRAEYGLDCAGDAPGETINASIVLVQWAGVMKAQPGATRTKAEALARATDAQHPGRGLPRDGST